MLEIVGLLYLADVYSSIGGTLVAFVALAWCVVVVSGFTWLLNCDDYKPNHSLIKNAKLTLLVSVILSVVGTLVVMMMPSEKFVQRACYIGVGVKLTSMAMEQVPDSVKTMAKTNVTNAVMQGMELPSNALGLLNGWTKAKLSELEAEIVGSEKSGEAK